MPHDPTHDRKRREGDRKAKGKPKKVEPGKPRNFVQTKGEQGMGRPPVARAPIGVPGRSPVRQNADAPALGQGRPTPGVPGQKPASGKPAAAQEPVIEQEIPGQRADSVTARQRQQTDEQRQAAQEGEKVPGETPEEQAQEKARLGLGKDPGEKPGTTIQPGGQPVQQLPGLDQKREFTVDRPMSPKEIQSGPVGIIHTPDASFEKMPNGEVKVNDFTEAGKAKLKEVEKRELEKFGDYPGKDDPQGPKPPIVAGQRWFNPFTGEWGGIDPDEKSILGEFE